jgi:archaetidylinositol phosphate synthase
VHVWRERLNQWLLPLAARLAISPNTITVLALLINLSAVAALIFAGSRPLLLPVASLGIAMGGLLDMLDGAVARAQGRASPFGDFLDHFCDRLSDLAILTGWCVGTSVRFPIMLAALLGVMLNGYIGTQIEATFRRRTYRGTGRGEFVLAAVAFPLIQFALVQAAYERARIGGLAMAEWLTAAIAVFAIVGMVERFAEALELGR